MMNRRYPVIAHCPHISQPHHVAWQFAIFGSILIGLSALATTTLATSPSTPPDPEEKPDIFDESDSLDETCPVGSSQGPDASQGGDGGHGGADVAMPRSLFDEMTPGAKVLQNYADASRRVSGMRTAYPISLHNGAVVETCIDVALPGPMIDWSCRRTYNSQISGDTHTGPKWLGGEADMYVYQDSSDVVLVVSSASKRTFTGGSLTPPANSFLKLEHKSADDEYWLTDQSRGLVWKFYDFTVADVVDRGKLKECTNRHCNGQGNVAIEYSYDSNGYPNTICTATGQDFDITLQYSGDDITSMTVNDGSTDIKKVEYTYKTGSHDSDVGTTGDLVQVKHSRRDSAGTGWIVRTTQYRYEADSRLKAVFEPDAVQRIIDDNSNISTPEAILTKSDDYSTGGTHDVIDFASRSFTYWTSNQSTSSVTTPWTANENLESKYGGTNLNETDYVKTETIRSSGAGAGCCGGGASAAVTKHYFYMSTSTSGTDENIVKTIVVEDTVDGGDNEASRRVCGMNDDGQALREVFIDDPTATTPKYWCKSWKLDSSSRVSEFRKPSAHNVVKATVDDYLKPFDGTNWTNDDNTLRAADGEILTYEYSTDGYRDGIKAKEGKNGTARYLWAVDYGDGTTNKPRYLIVASYEYPTKETTRTNGVKTEYTYVFHDSDVDHGIKQKTTTLPAISTSENGAGGSTGTVTEEYYDEASRLRWRKDGEGYVQYFSYHPESGQLAYEVQDADPTSLPSSADNNPTKWITKANGGANVNKPTRGAGLPTALQVVTTSEFDTQGRLTLHTDAGGGEHYTLYETDRTLTFPFWTGTTSLLPIQVQSFNGGGVVVDVYEVKPSIATSSAGVPTGLSSSSQSNYVSWTHFEHDAQTGQVTQVDRYHDIPSSGVGTMSSDFYRTVNQYDDLGQLEIIVEVASGTGVSTSVEQITRQTYDVLGRVIKVERGVSSATHNMGSSYATLPTLRQVSETVFDDAGVGDSHVTQSKRYHDSSNYTGEYLHYDFRGSLRGIEPVANTTKIAPYSVMDYDWMRRNIVTSVYTTNRTWSTVVDDEDYAATTTSNRNQHDKTYFDDVGQVYRRESHMVTGATLDGILRTDRYHDRRGLLVAEQLAHSAASEFAYDGLGRQYQSRVVSDLSGTKYSSGAFSYRAPTPKTSLTSMTGGNENVLELVHQDFDDPGNAIATYRVEMNHNDTNGVNALNLTSAQDWIRTTTYRWFDGADRVTDVAEYGCSATNDEWAYGTLPTRGSAPSASSSTVHLTEFAYNGDSGRLEEASDPEGTTSATFYDDLGRTKYVVGNYDNFDASDESDTGGGSNDDQDQVVKRVYDGLNNVVELVAMDQDGNGNTSDNQVTEYEFDDAYEGTLATKIIYPDSSSGSDSVVLEYALDGLPTKKTDQRGVVIDYTYNNYRLLEWEKASTVPAGVDGTIKSIKRVYDNLRRMTYVTSYATSTGTTAKNQILMGYQNGTDQVTTIRQDHDGSAAATAPYVRTYYDPTKDGSDLFTDGFRTYLVRYPSGEYVYYNSVATYADRLHRVDQIRGEHSGSFVTLAEYEYNGTSRLVTTDYLTPDVTSKMDEHATGDKVYENLDRFGRIKAKTWKDGSTVIDKYIYTYDYAGNRLSRDNTETTEKDQGYTYDGLHRLETYDRGTWNGSTITSKKFAQDWAHDALGNWTTFKQDDNGNGTWDLDQARGHNSANEITTIASSSTHVSQDAAGNMTKVPKPTSWSAHYDLEYDAWNRLVKVKDGETTVATYQYDGMGRRIVKDASGETDHYYYDHRWRCFEVRRTSETGTSIEAYVWHPQYIDALAVRYYDENLDDDYLDTDETEYVLHDANFNVTGLTDTTGAVQERYVYSPYGEVTVLNASWGTPSNTLANPYTYTGRRFDFESELYQYRNRYYHAQLGRFVSRDPIEYEGSQWNLYEYVRGRSPIGVDPLGLQTIGQLGKGQYIGCLTSECYTLFPDGEEIPNPNPDPRFTPGIKLCGRDINDDVCCSGAFNALGGQHVYIQFGPVSLDGYPIINGRPFRGEGEDEPEEFPGVGFAMPGVADERAFHPDWCIDYVPRRGATLPDGTPAGRATNAQFEKCLRNHKPTQNYRPLRYNCKDWAVEALESCGLERGTPVRLPRAASNGPN